MFCFKEWLQIDGIKTDIYDELVKMSIFERAARDTARLVLEALMSESEYDDLGGRDGREDFPIEGGISGKSRRQLKKELKDAILWIRWHAILERQQMIAKLKEMRDLHLEENPQFRDEAKETEKVNNDLEAKEVKESADDDFESLGAEFDLLEAIPLLEKTGYFDSQSARTKAGRNEDKYRESVREALYAAAKEKGNDLPLGVDAEEINKELPEQRKKFFSALHDLFLSRYRKIFFDSESSHKFFRGTKQVRGDKLFNEPEDVFTKFAEIVLDTITKRNVAERTLTSSSWDPIVSKSKMGQMGRQEIEKDSEETLDRIMKFLGFTLGKMKKKAQESSTKAHTVSLRMDDEITSRSEKKTLINKDTKETPPPGHGTSYYTDYLKKRSQGEEESIQEPSNTDNKRRFQIIQDIVYLSSRYPQELSLDPNKIKTTLLNYKDKFLGAKQKSHSFIGLIRTKDSDSGVGEEGGYDPVADDGLTRGGGGAESIPNPSSAASRQESVSNLIGDLKKVLDELSLDPQYRIGLLAFCMKFGLNCSPSNGKANSIDGIRNIITYMTTTGGIKGASKQHTCVGRLMSLGAEGMDTADKIARQMTSIIPFPENPTQNWHSYQGGIRDKMNKVIEEICKRMKAISDSRIEDASAQPAATNTRFDASRPVRITSRGFDASRPSPLSRFRKPV
jgi:hypothetical protein